jgi:hypothetical protein
MKTSFISEFKNPPAAYRGKPFWAWNGKLDPKELRRQVRMGSGVSPLFNVLRTLCEIHFQFTDEAAQCAI